jgi:hypothetical protein
VAINVQTQGLASAADAEQLFEMRRRHLVEIDRPMVLIGQVQRSGGTLLNSLFDGHPQVHAHPFQLKFARTKYDWPEGLCAKTELEARSALEMLHQVFIEQKFTTGYRKKAALDTPLRSLPFMIVPSFLEALFLEQCRERRPETSREVLDCYFTAFFNAWMDLEGLRARPKRWIVAFAPRMGWETGRRGFWRDYPDGRLIFVIRDPHSWFASEAGLPGHTESDTDWLELWTSNATEAIEAKREDPSRVFLVTFRALVRETEKTMRSLAEKLKIPFDPILTVPTFNRLPTEPNSTHGFTGRGIRRAPLKQWQNVLGEAKVEEIDRRTSRRMQQLKSMADIY